MQLESAIVIGAGDRGASAYASNVAESLRPSGKLLGIGLEEPPSAVANSIEFIISAYVVILMNVRGCNNGEH